jgi:hypothetical protein
MGERFHKGTPSDHNTLLDAVDTLHERHEHLETKIDELESALETAESRITDLEAENDQLHEKNNALEETLDTYESTIDELDALTNATRNRTSANKHRIEELQTRELEKGAHLSTETVDPHALDLDQEYVERFTKRDGTYYRLPDADDPLDGTDTRLAHADLLPIQQLARLDADMRRSTTSSLPTRLATKLWKARTDSTIDDDPWKRGSKTVRAYVDAGELKHWIRRQERGVSDAYAKKLVSRTIDAALELSKHRLAVHRRTQRKNGLSYTERRLVLPTDAELPGDRSRTEPETADVHGTA